MNYENNSINIVTLEALNSANQNQDERQRDRGNAAGLQFIKLK
ncbi:MAG: hypothetical protein ACI9K1_002685 [Arcticibacterium sp.]|jgi:hypothetical protein